MAIVPTTLSLSSGIGVVARAACANAPLETLTHKAAASAVAIQPADVVLMDRALLDSAPARPAGSRRAYGTHSKSK
jgi:PBP1b-binding outer membrane lipoprotein LpoB